jgi:ubiquinone/menaquinone biosynthesis C-methylase UbiE
MNKYVHGYSPKETQRLRDQSSIVEELLHGDTHYPPGSQVLEAGCGVGAQTRILARRNPDIQITSIDVSRKSLREAQHTIKNNGVSNVQLLQANILDLPFPEATFDHVFICFVLEHLEAPVKVLIRINQVLKRGGSVTVIEGDHSSFLWHPETPESRQVWQSLITAQASLGHDPLIGRKLYPLLAEAGFSHIKVTPRSFYADEASAEAKSNSLNKILIPMIESAKQQALDLKAIDAKDWAKGIGDFRRLVHSAKATGFYTWFKAVAIK